MSFDITFSSPQPDEDDRLFLYVKAKTRLLPEPPRRHSKMMPLWFHLHPAVTRSQGLHTKLELRTKTYEILLEPCSQNEP